MNKLSTILAVHAEMPSRHSVAILESPVTATRLSRGRSDKVVIGAIAQHPKGYGIVRSGRKDCYDGDWIIVAEIAPPATDSERDAIAASMARKWDEVMSAVMMGAPDDERNREQHESARAAYVRLRNTLRAAALLS